MTDKFVVSTNTVGEIIVTDVETGNVYRRDNISRFFGLIRLMNKLNNERMMYKTTIDKRIVELEEENEQLKKRLEHYAKVEAMDGDGTNE